MAGPDTNNGHALKRNASENGASNGASGSSLVNSRKGAKLATPLHPDLMQMNLYADSDLITWSGKTATYPWK